MPSTMPRALYNNSKIFIEPCVSGTVLGNSNKSPTYWVPIMCQTWC